jgi:hypothetical protein
MTHHIGYDRGDPAGAGTGNSRNGSSTKTVSTTNGPVTISVPPDRSGKFEPKIVPKRARRVGQIDELVLSLYARGLSTRDIEAHLLEVYGVKASRELISNVTDVVTDEIEIWRNRPVDELAADQRPDQLAGPQQGLALGDQCRATRACRGWRRRAGSKQQSHSGELLGNSRSQVSELDSCASLRAELLRRGCGVGCARSEDRVPGCAHPLGYVRGSSQRC